jgi:type II restriction enzyme
LFDRKCAFLGNNIDATLLDNSAGLPERDCFADKACYLACGELKGGIDPAGADKHWKTANSALNRIRGAFTENRPQLFFVGAAIEATMAGEIFAQLSDGRLTYAANLTVPEQVADLAIWLSGL